MQNLSRSIILEKRIPIFVIGVTTPIIYARYLGGNLDFYLYLITAVIGYCSLTQKNALINGVLYVIGFYVSNFFIVEGNSNIRSIVGYGLISIFIGALYGLALAYIGYSVRVIIHKRNR